jgi:hypothetical protein
VDSRSSRLLNSYLVYDAKLLAPGAQDVNGESDGESLSRDSLISSTAMAWAQPETESGD